MTRGWRSGYLRTGLSIRVRQRDYHRLVSAHSIAHNRHFAQKPSTSSASDGVTATPADPVKSALTIIQSKARVDPINPPRSTIPPPLSLPTRGDESKWVYWFRIGKAYGTFYKDGIKAVYFNYQASKILKNRINLEYKAKNVTEAVSKKLITRSEFQLLARNSHDIGKLPVFGLLVLIFGEWLVFVVPFVPNRVPGTCRIPSQIRGMRLTAEERRRHSFRQGITEPSKEQFSSEEVGGSEKTKGNAVSWPVAFSAEYRKRMVKNFRDDQLYHISSSLGLHNRLWDRVQLPPPAFLLRRGINKRMTYLCQDDFLILENGGPSRLTQDELHTACEERGIDVLGKKDETLRNDLTWWLKREQEDRGAGYALLTMLFRRLAMREWVQLNLKANRE